jgi:hypothetical protein
MSAATLKAILQAVESQRALLINAIAALECAMLSCRDRKPPADLDGALELIGEELQRILGALEGSALERAAAEEVQS